jgi:hypothetical protein
VRDPTYVDFVSIDTQAFVKTAYCFTGKVFEALKAHFASRRLKLVVTDIAVREVHARIRQSSPSPKSPRKGSVHGPKWGKAPNGKSGWVDAKGNVWVPTGQAPGIAHGGPHWDVQQDGGGYQNVRPGGKLQ